MFFLTAGLSYSDYLTNLSVGLGWIEDNITLKIIYLSNLTNIIYDLFRPIYMPPNSHMKNAVMYSQSLGGMKGKPWFKKVQKNVTKVQSNVAVFK